MPIRADNNPNSTKLQTRPFQLAFALSLMLSETKQARQVDEPTFPFAAPPTCRTCRDPGIRSNVRQNNPIGNAERWYYICPGTHKNNKGYFIAFDDDGGIEDGNPQCWCRYTTRLCLNRDGVSQFYACPIGQCEYWRNGPPLSQKEMRGDVDSMDWEPTLQ
jgi:hypothetical protein